MKTVRITLIGVERRAQRTRSGVQLRTELRSLRIVCIVRQDMEISQQRAELVSCADVRDLADLLAIVLPLRVAWWRQRALELLAGDVAVDGDVEVVRALAVEEGLNVEGHPLENGGGFVEGCEDGLVEAVVEGDECAANECAEGGEEDERQPGAAQECAHWGRSMDGGSCVYALEVGVSMKSSQDSEVGVSCESDLRGDAVGMDVPLQSQGHTERGRRRIEMRSRCSSSEASTPTSSPQASKSGGE